MVVPIRELVNKSSISTYKAFSSHKLVQSSTNMNLDINMATLRERLLSYQSHNSRESSVLSTASSVPYYKRMEYQSWSKQIKIEVALGNSE